MSNLWFTIKGNDWEKVPSRYGREVKMINILVCDDDKEIVDAIEIYLSQDGYQIFSHSDCYVLRKLTKNAGFL